MSTPGLAGVLVVGWSPSECDPALDAVRRNGGNQFMKDESGRVRFHRSLSEPAAARTVGLVCSLLWQGVAASLTMI